MITVGFIKAGDQARVDYYLSRAALEESPRTLAEGGEALGRYYGGATANGPGRWLGRGADSLGLAGQAVEPETFTRAVLEGYLDGAARAKPVMRTHPDGLVAAEPFAAAVRRLGAADRFTSGRAGQEWASLERVALRYGTVPAYAVAKLARAAGIDPAPLYGADSWAHALEWSSGKHQVD